MKYLLILMSGFKISDGLLTDHFVRQGSAREGNPLVEGIVTGGGFLWFSIAGAVLCTVGLWCLSRRFPRLTGATAATVAAFYVAAITWNLGVVFGA